MNAMQSEVSGLCSNLVRINKIMPNERPNYKQLIAAGPTCLQLDEGFASQEVPSRETRGDQGEEVHWHPPGQKNITPPGPEVNPKDNPEKIRRLGDFNFRNAQRVNIRTLER
nr:unnamed protein product [Callosobruchus chinensis]